MAAGLAAAMALAAPGAAHGAVDMFLKLDGIDGESQDKLHAGEIEIFSWSWGLSNSAGKRPSFEDLSLTKYIDRSSPLLLQAVGGGTEFPRAILTVRKSGTQQDFLRFCMTRVRVTSLSTGGSGGEDRLSEEVTLSYQTIVEEYQPQDGAGGNTGSPITGGWNVVRHLQYGTWDC